MKEKRNHDLKRYFSVCVVALFIFAITMVGTASAKSVHVIVDHHARPIRIRVYDILDDTPKLVYQTEYKLENPKRANSDEKAKGACSLAMYNPDGMPGTGDEVIFITYEKSNVIGKLSAVDFKKARIKTLRVKGALDLAGIVVNQKSKLVYTVDRMTNHLYIYNADTLDIQKKIDLPEIENAYGIALNEEKGWLFVTAHEPTVRYFDINNWTKVGEFKVDHDAISIAVDATNNFVYTGAAFVGNSLLCKYNIKTGKPKSVDLSAAGGAMGVAVDQDSHLLYVTTGSNGTPSPKKSFDDLRIFDSELNELFVTPKIPDPAGICVVESKVVEPKPIIPMENNTISNNIKVEYGYPVKVTEKLFEVNATIQNMNNKDNIENVMVELKLEECKIIEVKLDGELIKEYEVVEGNKNKILIGNLEPGEENAKKILWKLEIDKYLPSKRRLCVMVCSDIDILFDPELKYGYMVYPGGKEIIAVISIC